VDGGPTIHTHTHTHNSSLYWILQNAWTLIDIFFSLPSYNLKKKLGTLKAKISKLKSELINGPGGKSAGSKDAGRGFDGTFIFRYIYIYIYWYDDHDGGGSVHKKVSSSLVFVSRLSCVCV
jgi:hypothetical protein